MDAGVTTVGRDDGRVGAGAWPWKRRAPRRSRPLRRARSPCSDVSEPRSPPPRVRLARQVAAGRSLVWRGERRPSPVAWLRAAQLRKTAILVLGAIVLSLGAIRLVAGGVVDAAPLSFRGHTRDCGSGRRCAQSRRGGIVGVAVGVAVDAAVADEVAVALSLTGWAGGRGPCPGAGDNRIVGGGSNGAARGWL